MREYFVNHFSRHHYVMLALLDICQCRELNLVICSFSASKMVKLWVQCPQFNQNQYDDVQRYEIAAEQYGDVTSGGRRSNEAFHST